MVKAALAVVIGRFQPFHRAHEALVRRALDVADRALVLVGSARSAPSPRNPWTYDDRRWMVEATFASGFADRTVGCAPIRDHLYNDEAWVAQVQGAVAEHLDGIDEPDGQVVLVGHFKDDSSYYLRMFPQWELDAAPAIGGLDATSIRDAIFKAHLEWRADVVVEKITPTINRLVPAAVANKILPELGDERFARLAEEHEFVRQYRARWSSAPFPPTFVTVDAVVIQSGHVLLIKRGRNPGRGRLALPGGFLNQNERIFDGAVRELFEETRIDLPRKVLEKSCAEVRVFDHPLRDARGRSITHAHLFRPSARGGELPAVEADDDADDAFWEPLSRALDREDEFFGDHYHIVSHFARKL